MLQCASRFVSAFSALFFFAFVATPAEAADFCEYASQKFSIGSARCECPSYKVEGLGGTGENSRLTSARVVCTKDGWSETQSLCVDMGKMNILAEYYKLARMYCPLSLNPEETERVFKDANNASSLAAVKGICSRLGGASGVCKNLIDTLAK